MALSSELNRQTYTATAGQTVFPFTLPFFDATTVSGVKYGDIKVYREETDGTLTSLTANETPAAGQFKIETSNPANGCNVTLGFSASAGDTIVIERDVAYTQEYDLQEGSTIDPTALNKALDRVVAQNQQQNDLFTRTVEFPVTDSGVTYTVGSATSRANKALGFDVDGNVTELDIAEEGGFSVNSNAGLDLTAGQLSAKVDGVTTEFSGGNIAVKNSSITTSKLVDDSVNESKIADDSVTYAKMQDVATSNSLLGNSATGQIEERAVVGDILLNDSTLAANSSTQGVTQSSVKSYVDALMPKYVAIDSTAGATALSQTQTTANASPVSYTYTLSDFRSTSAGNTPTLDINRCYQLLVKVDLYRTISKNSYVTAAYPDGTTHIVALSRSDDNNSFNGNGMVAYVPINPSEGQTTVELAMKNGNSNGTSTFTIIGAMQF